MNQHTLMKRILFLAFLIITAFLFSTCSDNGIPDDILADFKTDGIIDNTELLAIEEKISSNRYLSRKFKTVEDIIAQLLEMGLEVKKDQSSNQNNTTASVFDSVIYDIYLENSGSMYGYINGRTELEEAMMGLWTEIARRDEDLNIHFINDKIYPVKKEFEEFFKYLQPFNVSKEGGNTGSSNIASILDTVIITTVKKDKPAIVFSDFIFSLEKGGKIVDQLSVQKYGLKSIVIRNNLVEKDMGILVIKLSSKFDGRYYDFQNKPTVLKDKERPYYMWVIGKVDLLKAFAERYRVPDLKGYLNHTLLYSADYSQHPYHTILKKTNVVGGFDKVDRHKDMITKIKNVEVSGREDLFQFAVAVDLSDLPLNEDYILDRNNYRIDPNPDATFEIIDVDPIKGTNINKVDKKIVGSATHVITVGSQKIKSGKNTLGISLLKQLPRWIEESSVDNDEDVNAIEGKTFGFRYLVEGINDGFKPLENVEEKYLYLEFQLEK